MTKKNGDTLPIQPAAPKKRKDPNERVRKIGEREEIVEHKLTQLQLEDMKDDVMNLLDQKKEIEERKKEVAKNHASQLATVELLLESTLRTIRAGRRSETIIVEEHLTASNEVIRIRKDTGDQIGARTATPRELQEEMFADKPPADPAPGGQPQIDAPMEETVAEFNSAFGGEPQ